MLVEESVERRAARTSIEPQDDRIGRRGTLRGNEDVVVVLLGIGDVDVS
jgi:hypothetical protein